MNKGSTRDLFQPFGSFISGLITGDQDNFNKIRLVSFMDENMNNLIKLQIHWVVDGR